jgi:hypothetical protein
MGVVRLAKCLKYLSSLKEYKNRKADISDKINGNRVYMDFVSIVYKEQQRVASELNYLLFSFHLMNLGIIDLNVLLSEKMSILLKQYSTVIPQYQQIVSHIKAINISKNKKSAKKQFKLSDIVDEKFIDIFKSNVRKSNVISRYVYDSVVFFVIDLLTQKLQNVEYVLIAFDGIPSFGKIQEQRQRRYMKYTFMEFQKAIEKLNLQNIVEQSKTTKYARYLYDQDHIYVDIRSAIDYVYNMYHLGNLQHDISAGIKISENNQIVQIDVIDKQYGEGEKILMDLLIKDYDKYQDAKSYVFYSPDGDSVILCLHIYIRTKIKELVVVKTYNLNPSAKHNDTSQYVDIKNLYEQIVAMTSGYSNNKDFDQNQQDLICSDFIVMMNLFGNDFIHQIPTMEISSTFIDLMYIYASFLDKNLMFLTSIAKNNNDMFDKVNINYHHLQEFLLYLASFENLMILDTYLTDTEEKQKISRVFNGIFPLKSLLEYQREITNTKKSLYNVVKGLTQQQIQDTLDVKLDELDKLKTYNDRSYKSIWIKSEIKSASDYAAKIATKPHILLSKYPKHFYNIKPKIKKTENELIELIDQIEGVIVKNNGILDPERINDSSDQILRDFSFDYTNIRDLTPHEQMPATFTDISLYSLEWRTGRWTNILNSANLNLGFDPDKNIIKNIGAESKRYQYDVLKMSNTKMTKMVQDYLRTLSWLNDYYTNTDYEGTSTEISTWSYNYDRSPFLQHIATYLQSVQPFDLENLMKGFYQKSLVSTDNYLKTDRHKLYIYPQTNDTIAKIPNEYREHFPDMSQYVAMSLDMYNSNKDTDVSTVFDCRMCPYFSKCLFKNRHITFRDLMKLDIRNILQYSIMKRPNVHINNNNVHINNNNVHINNNNVITQIPFTVEGNKFGNQKNYIPHRYQNLTRQFYIQKPYGYVHDNTSTYRIGI